MRLNPRAPGSVAGVTAVAAALAAAGCTLPGAGAGGSAGANTGHGSVHVSSKYVVAYDGTGGTNPDGMDHGGAAAGGMPGMGHGHMPATLNHAPSEAQKAGAKRLIADTRAAAARHGQTTLAGLIAQGYISIGDEITGTTHYVKPAYHYDQYNLDPDHVEAYAVRMGRPVAAMYILSNGTDETDIPDVAGNWTMWHNHTLSWQSNNQYSPGYYRLGGMFVRKTASMLHVWLTKHNCGPFAGTDVGGMTGSCNNGIE